MNAVRHCFAILSLFYLVGPIMGQSDKKITKVDALFEEFNRPNTPGAVVMVIQDGRTVCARAYGLACLEPRSACATNTNFRLASLTKQFTAMAIMILAERGRLSLDDRLDKFFPEFPAYGADITVRQLLNHTSGLKNYEDLIPAGTTIPVSDRDVVLLLMKQTQTDFLPGIRYRYSNTGYALLALIVEVVSERKFAAFLKENLFNPLGMTGTVAYEAGLSVVPHRAFGYAQKDGGGFEFSDQSLTSAVLGDGGIYSSLADLFLWDQALYTEKLVSRRMLAQAFTPVKSSEFPDSGYGFGWFIGQYRGTARLWHYGSTCGFSTRIERYPEKRLTVIVLANRRDAILDGLLQKITELYF